MKNFKFTVGKEMRGINNDRSIQYVRISLEAPMLVFPIELSKNNLHYEDKLRLAKAELKVAIMEALLNGEWEFENL